MQKQLMKIMRIRSPRTNRDKFYDQTGKLLAYYEEPDVYGDSELTITEYGIEQNYYSHNRKLANHNNSLVFCKVEK